MQSGLFGQGPDSLKSKKMLPTSVGAGAECDNC